MTHMQQEILEQPIRLKESFEYNYPVLQEIAKEFREKKIHHIVLAARGSSDKAGIYFKYLSEIKLSIPVTFAAPSVVTIYKKDVDYADSLVIGVSQSGQAKDVIAVLDSANRQNAMTVTITNYENSQLAKTGKYHLHLHVGEEKSIAATKTFTAQLFLLGLLVSLIGQDKPFENALFELPNILKNVLGRIDEIQGLAKLYANVKSCFVLGRGYQYAIAEEVALKLMETTYIHAFSYAFSDFYHGPLALADEHAHALIFAPSDETFDNSLEMISELKKKKVHLIVFSDHEIKGLEHVLVLPKASPEVMPMVNVVAAHLFAMFVAIEKGLNPDSPRSLKKVTITE